MRAKRSLAASAGLHGLVMLTLLVSLRHAPQLVTAKLPGTALGTVQLTYYSPGGPPHVGATTPVRVVRALSEPPPAPKLPEKAVPKEDAALANAGTGASAESGLGEGDLRIALPTFFPYPKPSLATMTAGSAGDVVLDAIIDEHGKISQLTLLHGLGPAIDENVIATVRQWTYNPATRDGKPVASGQELHFHYERS